MASLSICAERFTALVVVALLAACSAARRVEPDRAIAIPNVQARIVYLAEQEWRIFGKQTVIYYEDGEPRIRPGHHEEEPPHLTRVLAYWQANTDVDILDKCGRIRPWSAAFISWIMRQAGVRDTEFQFSVLHWDYIEAALIKDELNGFHAFDAATTVPRPGDLLCAPRAGTAELVKNFADLQRGFYHCDIVVGVSNGALEVIGGNVGDSVSRSRAEIDALGRVVPTAARPWVVVLSIGGWSAPRQ